MEANAVRVGDKMRFSTELLRHIHDAPGHRSELVVVERIDREADGCLSLFLKRAPAASQGNGNGNGS
jgi:hypothetical protein